MKYLKKFESNNDLEMIRKINTNYKNEFMVSVREDHEIGSDEYYDIFYRERKWIFIGVFNFTKNEFTIFTSDSISNYNSSIGPDHMKQVVWKSTLDEFNFDLFVNKWYDFIDNL